MVLLRRLLGDALRAHRQSQSRTLREVARTARVSLGYLSEVERGQKEASSELLAAICTALGVRLSEVLREVSDGLADAELAEPVPVPVGAPETGGAEGTGPVDVASPVPGARPDRPATVLVDTVAAA